MKSGWQTNTRKFRSKLRLGIATKNIQIAKRAFELLVGFTPVHTGSLRASWRVALNRADKSITTSTDSANPLPPPKMPSIKALGPNDRILITNSQPYGRYVNDGSPTTIPIAMVQRTMAVLR